MVQVQAGRIGPSGVGSAAYENKADTDQVIIWYAHGARNGVLAGLTLAGVPGQMALDVAAGAALVSRRDASRNLQALGYVLWEDAVTRVPFGVASASARNDALVAAVVDTTDGAVGTGALANGGHLVVVPGVSGTTTVRTDTQIQTYLGRGGWVRLADVPIASADTQINTANIVATAESVPFVDSGAIANAFTAATGWTITAQSLRRIGRNFYFEVTATRTGADLTHSGTGNISNTNVATWDEAKYPILFQGYAVSGENGGPAHGFARTDGTLIVAGVSQTSALTTGTGIQLTGHWVSA